ncbi:type II secretion system ATPase GspE [Ostreibacterium oceani]|uniref:Type II secretion system protein E n=1 Tax=Ostreibacterium oceani TaxID=2654998 RepID=A0A6N7ET50_9GAMM|nr:type II secretion system ATPase GspE [Ostreibacterium oceani]MPV85731.1 type II secretion system protein GspE [Ostreibacterium oceani]
MPSHTLATVSDDTVIAQLLSKGYLREDSLLRAQKVSETTSDSVLKLLVKLGSLSDRHLAETLAHLLEVKIIEESNIPEDLDLSSIGVPEQFLVENALLPIAVTDERLDVVMVDPRDQFLIQSLAIATGKKINALIGLPVDIERFFEKLHKGDSDDMSLFGVNENDIEHLKDLANDAPVIRLVNGILQQAVEQRASDIHIEPFENRMKVRYRIDGVLVEAETLSAQQSAAVISRVKIMAKLNIAERRLPQDGRIQFRVQGKDLDLRVSTTPTLWGESVVMRILDREQVILDFVKLGFEPELLNQFLAVLNQPHGIILVTGPTGSGKSTTLYTALSHINSPTRKIITAEDPVEYQLEGVNQIQVKPQIGLTFASALRAIVRQDPDVIMVGEMRDLETAQIAVQSALTGHLVLSTLHTNDAPGSISRLLDMGIEDYMIATTVIGILAQRLLRQLCEHCKTPVPIDAKLADELCVTDILRGREMQSHAAVGCAHCGGTGYKGRLAITEFMPINDKLRQVILKRATAQELSQTARAQGMRTLFEDGILKVAAGMTTLEEVLRVTQQEG